VHYRVSVGGNQTAIDIQTETLLLRSTTGESDMIDEDTLDDLKTRLEKMPRASLALLPTPLQALENFGKSLGGLNSG